jgi:hypothetical protein
MWLLCDVAQKQWLCCVQAVSVLLILAYVFV